MSASSPVPAGGRSNLGANLGLIYLDAAILIVGTVLAARALRR